MSGSEVRVRIGIRIRFGFEKELRMLGALICIVKIKAGFSWFTLGSGLAG